MRTHGFLPVLSSCQDAASFPHAVLPFFHAAVQHMSEHQRPLEAYATTNPFVSGFILSLFMSAFLFVAGTVTGNWSW
jgi:hypothetical protein